MSPIATMMTTSMMLATRNRGPASHRRRHARAADQNSRTHTAQIRQATVRRRDECMRRQRVLARASAEQASAEQSGRDTSDEPIVMAYPVLFDSGDGQVLPLAEPPVRPRAAISHSSGDWVPPAGGGDWVPPHQPRSADLATPEEARATETACDIAASRDSPKRRGGRRRQSGLGWLQCCSARSV